MTSDGSGQVAVDKDDAENTDEGEMKLLGNGNNVNKEVDDETDGATTAIEISDTEPSDEPDKVNRKRKNGLRDIIRNIRQDSLYRQKFVHTCILWWSFVGLGWAVGMSGPTFPDLREIINEDLATASWIFPAGGLGYLIGSLVGGVLYDMFNKILLLAISSLGLGLSTTATPFCPTLPWLLFIRFAGGAFCGGLDVGGNSNILFIWGENSNSYIQAIHFGFSFGASISPYVTEPFLAKKIRSCPVSDNGTSVKVSCNSTACIKAMSDIDSFDNYTTISDEPRNITYCTEAYEPSSVYIAFIIAGVVILSSTIGFVYLYIKSKQNKQDEKKRADDTKQAECKESRKMLTTGAKVFFLALLGILFGTYCIAEDGFASYLMTFAIERLKWEKSTGSFATGLFWLSFGVGRFAGIFITACCQTTILLTAYLIMLGCAFVGFLLSTLFYVDALIWLFTVMLGVSMSVIFPAILSWTSEHIIEVTGKISAFFMVTAALSGTFCMILIGNLMYNYDPMWFVYIMEILMVTCLISFGVLRITSRIYSTTKSDKMSVDQDDCVELKLMKPSP